jgi:hypothetical protein
MMTRAHVILPEDLIDDIDRRVGRRKRSQFISETLDAELRRLRRIEAAEAAGGSLRDVDVPGWESAESSIAWLRQLRRQSDDSHAAAGSAREQPE